MLKNIKKRIDTYLDRKFNKLYKKQRLNNQIAFNYAQLNNLFVNTSFYIPFTGWSMSPSTITHVLNDIVVNNRQCIVEFGSGASTFYIAKLLKSNNIEASFFTIESNADWAEKIKKQLEVLDLTNFVTIITAPIKSIDKSLTLDNQELWYGIDKLDEHLNTINTIDLVLVDGPFGGLTPNARFSAVPYLKNKLAKSFIVFLDDMHRDEEKNILKLWGDILNCSNHEVERYGFLSNETQFYSKPLQL